MVDITVYPKNLNPVYFWGSAGHEWLCAKVTLVNTENPDWGLGCGGKGRGGGGEKGVANKILFRHLMVEFYHAPCLTYLEY